MLLNQCLKTQANFSLKRNWSLSTLLIRGFSNSQVPQQIGSFEQHFQIPPRYFLVTYKLNDNFQDESDQYREEHTSRVKKLIEGQRIVFRGDVRNKENNGHSEIFFVYQAKDERDPHSFIMGDQYYQNGLVKNWEIKELDLIHAERDDEIMISSKYR
ncbi:UNKNOWN [Stylonychia lemnae]|uniref:YCII-related domain-containing protein n=1 Tax=Stylonychia lemnae TaxID=5949 RepID=A0A078B347_STYLE|nr:UNKNOWN [Stylonychia lemnae]|eukprot:CDW88940.1 UNKNOWN [Stylonychia lemnae]